MLRVVFVCSGNICRSPMAQYIFEAQAQRRGVPHMTVSMGTLGLVGQPAPAEAIAVCEEIGVDITPHQSQPLSAAILKHATQIFVMEPHHVEALQKIGIAGEHVQHLGIWDPDDARPVIDDPVDQPVEIFRAVRARIERAIERFLDETAPSKG